MLFHITVPNFTFALHRQNCLYEQSEWKHAVSFQYCDGAFAVIPDYIGNWYLLAV